MADEQVLGLEPAERSRRPEPEQRVHAGRLVAGAEERNRPERVGDEQEPPLRPPERHLLPPAIAGATGRSSNGAPAISRGTTWCGTPSLAAYAPRSRGCAGRAAARRRPARRGPDPVVEPRPSTDVEEPDAAVDDECMRGPLHPLVLDPAESELAFVDEPDAHASRLTASARPKRPRQIALPTTAPSQPKLAERVQVVERRDPAGGDHGQPGFRTSSRRGRSPWTASRPAALLVDHQPRNASGGALLGEAARRRRGGHGPAVDGELPVACVHGDRKPGRVPLDRRVRGTLR